MMFLINFKYWLQDSEVITKTVILNFRISNEIKVEMKPIYLEYENSYIVCAYLYLLQHAVLDEYELLCQ